MKIVVIGGNGLIGTQLVKNLRLKGHDVIAASRSSGVNTITGEGLSQAFSHADVVVDVANSPSFETNPALEFFKTSGKNIFAAEKENHIKHHVALSVVGTDRLLANGYFQAKLLQEELIKTSKIPYTIVRATQFFEFAEGIAQSGTEGDEVKLPHALFQPVAANDVADLLTEIAIGKPLNKTIELAGPEAIPLDEFVRMFLTAKKDKRNVITDTNALYFGLKVNDKTLNPGDHSRLGSTHYEDWLKKSLHSK
jgi:uncharacterized protein YbjT (DUF2867 family)